MGQSFLIFLQVGEVIFHPVLAPNLNPVILISLNAHMSSGVAGQPWSGYYPSDSLQSKNAGTATARTRPQSTHPSGTSS